MWCVFLSLILSITINCCSHTQNLPHTHLKPPNRNMMSGNYFDHLYDSNWKTQMNSLMFKARIFGLTMFGDGATIKTCPLINILVAGVNNPFALLDVVDCTNHAPAGNQKDAKYIARLIHPFIEKMELECDGPNKSLTGTVDLVFFDGATNVQNAGKILTVLHPRSVLGMARSMLFCYLFQMCSENVTNMPCFQNFVNPAATYGGRQRTSHLQCSNITARFITMEFVLDLSSPLNVEWLGNTLHSCGFSD
jgi:hypothetical protein